MEREIQQELLGIVKRNYDEIAEDFSETRKKYLWPELLKLTANIKNDDKVLDVGCGNGRLLEAFRGKRIEYVGVDKSEKFIGIAKRQSSKFKVQSSKFVVNDILELDKLLDTDFNYIFCVAVLHHIPGRDLRIKALRQMKDKLRPGGKIILTNWNLWCQPKFRKLLLKATLRKIIGLNRYNFGDIVFKGFKQDSDRYYYAFTMGELKRIIKIAGLKIDKLYKDEFNYYAVVHEKKRIKNEKHEI